MFIIIYLMTFTLLFFFHPLTENITALQSTSYALVYYIYVLSMTAFLCVKTHKMTLKLQINKNKFIILFCCFFLIGALLPYHYNKLYFFETMHVLCTLIGCLGLLYIEKELITHLMKIDYQIGYALYHYFLYFTIILGTLAVMFGTINGIVEIYFICTNLFILYKIDDFLFNK